VIRAGPSASVIGNGLLPETHLWTWTLERWSRWRWPGSLGLAPSQTPKSKDPTWRNEEGERKNSRWFQRSKVLSFVLLVSSVNFFLQLLFKVIFRRRLAWSMIGELLYSHFALISEFRLVHNIVNWSYYHYYLHCIVFQWRTWERICVFPVHTCGKEKRFFFVSLVFLFGMDTNLMMWGALLPFDHIVSWHTHHKNVQSHLEHRWAFSRKKVRKLITISVSFDTSDQSDVIGSVARSIRSPQYSSMKIST
jgi:hypothetical protein